MFFVIVLCSHTKKVKSSRSTWKSPLCLKKQVYCMVTLTNHPPPPYASVSRAWNFKLFRSPRIDSKEQIPPGGPVRQPYYYSVPSPHRLFKNSSTELAHGPIHKDDTTSASTVFPVFINIRITEQNSEPEFVNLLWSPGIDSRPGGTERKPYLKYRPAKRHRLAESFLGIDSWVPETFTNLGSVGTYYRCPKEIACNFKRMVFRKI